MAVLATVGEYVAEARVLLQDNMSPYRYSDTSMKMALALALLQMRKMRPDIFIGVTAPSLTPSSADTVSLPIDEVYRLPLLNFMAGYVQLRDEEGGSEQRASMFMNAFATQIMGV